jgi:hypothetical protein
MTTPILTAAAARKPRRNPRALRKTGGRGEAKFPPNNYLAQPVKKKAGAPLGNRNAARGGAEKRDRQARLDALIRSFYATADAVIASCDQAAWERGRLVQLLEASR